LTLTLLGLLGASSQLSSLLFHTVVEILTVALSLTLFLFVWNAHRYLQDRALLVVGVAYGFSAVLDLVHALAFPGMGVLPTHGANLATLSSTAAQFLRALALWAAPWLARTKAPPGALLALLGAVAVLTLGGVVTGAFAAWPVEGEGLLRFKEGSEALICLLLAAALVLWARRKDPTDPDVPRAVLASIGLTILAELSFTAALGAPPLANLLGHLFKVAALFFLYRAVAQAAGQAPFRPSLRELQGARTALGDDVVDGARALRESEGRFRAVFEHSPLGKTITSLDGTLVEVNRAFARMLGGEPRDFVGHSYLEFTLPDDRNPSTEVTQALVEGRLSVARLEKGYRALDGREVWAEVITSILRSPEGLPLHFFTSVHDLTEQRALEAEKEALQAQLAAGQKLEAVGLLAGGVAHDFNNLLAVILGRLELLKQSPDLPAPLGRHLDPMERAAGQAAQLTRQLLAFARKQSMVPRILDLNEAVSAGLVLVRSLVKGPVEVHWDPRPDLAPVRLDPGQVEQIVLNLGVNGRDAIQARGAGGGTLRFSTEAADLTEADCRGVLDARPGRYVVLRVRDDGEGMEPEVRARIFEPFFSTKERGRGSGLGLAMVYGIVRQNEGFVAVSSAPGQGADFRVYFPAQEGSVTPRSGPEAPVPRLRGPVLLAEDEALLREVLEEMLQELGYPVTAVAGPREALAWSDRLDQFALLVTDISMPGMDGRDLAAQLRTRRPGLKVLFVSGHASAGDTGPGTGFLSKPFTQSDLNQALDRLLTPEPS